MSILLDVQAENMDLSPSVAEGDSPFYPGSQPAASNTSTLRRPALSFSNGRNGRQDPQAEDDPDYEGDDIAIRTPAPKR